MAAVALKLWSRNRSTMRVAGKAYRVSSLTFDGYHVGEGAKRGRLQKAARMMVSNPPTKKAMVMEAAIWT